MLEKMATFFEARLEGYDAHMLEEIDGAAGFYPFTASLLPRQAGARVLDLGCGTGLELEEYFKLNPQAQAEGIDLSAGMLAQLHRKLPQVWVRQGSYFDLPFEREWYDAVVSVESLHHFTQAEKMPLYQKVYGALKSGGIFVLTDYFAPSEQLERQYRADYLRLRAEQGIEDEDFYHYDTPLTVEHETEALRYGGFKKIEILKNWSSTYTLRCEKE